MKNISEIWTQILLLDKFHKYVLLQKLLVDVALDNKKLVEQDVDEDKLIRFVEYLTESVKG